QAMEPRPLRAHPRRPAPPAARDPAAGRPRDGLRRAAGAAPPRPPSAERPTELARRGRHRLGERGERPRAGRRRAHVDHREDLADRGARPGPACAGAFRDRFLEAFCAAAADTGFATVLPAVAAWRKRDPNVTPDERAAIDGLLARVTLER